MKEDNSINVLDYGLDSIEKMIKLYEAQIMSNDKYRKDPNLVICNQLLVGNIMNMIGNLKRTIKDNDCVFRIEEPYKSSEREFRSVLKKQNII